MKRLIMILVALVVIFAVYKLLTFELFENEVKQLETIEISDESFELAIYHSPSNATVEGSIQIRKLHNDGVQETVANYQRFNHLIGFERLSDHLILIIEDTIREKIDTVKYRFR